MPLFALLSVLRRYFFAIFIIAALAATATFFTLRQSITWHVGTDFTVTFRSLAASNSIQNDPLASSQLANFFTETIEGWTRSASFTQNIAALLPDHRANLQISKLSRQNFTITAISSDQISARELRDATKTTLSDLVTDFNKKSNGGLVLFDRGDFSRQSEQNKQIYILLAALLAAGISFFTFLAAEIFRGTLSTHFQAADILSTRHLGKKENIPALLLAATSPLILLNLTGKDLNLTPSLSTLCKTEKIDIGLFSDQKYKKDGRFTSHPLPKFEEHEKFIKELKTFDKTIIEIKSLQKLFLLQNNYTIVAIKEGKTKITDLEILHGKIDGYTL